jgi:hypothetical protein
MNIDELIHYMMKGGQQNSATPVIDTSDYTHETTRVVCLWRFMSMFLSRLVFLLLAIIQNC